MKIRLILEFRSPHQNVIILKLMETNKIRVSCKEEKKSDTISVIVPSLAKFFSIFGIKI